MKYTLHCKSTIILALLISAIPVLAQVEVGLRLEPRKALLDENIIAYVDVNNNTTEAIRIGGNQSNAEISFNIREMNGNYISKRSKAMNLNDVVTVEPFKRKTIAVDIVSLYNIVKPRPYKISCNIEWKGETYESGQTYFDVVPGIFITSKVVQLPGENGIVRKFSLIYIYRNKKARLFMKVNNTDDSICYGVYNFGDYIRIQDAKMEVDNRGRIHLLYQSGPRRFSYYIINTHGKTEKSMFYAGIAGKIDLLRSDLGEVFVDGGQKYEGDRYSAPYEFEKNRIFE